MEEETQELTPQVVLPLTHRGHRMHVPAYTHIKMVFEREGVMESKKGKEGNGKM